MTLILCSSRLDQLKMIRVKRELISHFYATTIAQNYKHILYICPLIKRASFSGPVLTGKTFTVATLLLEKPSKVEPLNRQSDVGM